MVSNTLLIGALVVSNQLTVPAEGQFWTSDGTSANAARLGTVAVGFAFHLEGLREEGASIPKPSSQVEYVEVAA